MSESLIPSFLVSDVSESFRSLTKNERCEQIAQVAHQKWANEWIARFFERIAHSLIFGQKTSDSLGKPMSEFPALKIMNRTFALLLSKNEQFTRTTKEQIPNPASFPLGPFSLSHNTTTRPHPKQTVAHFSTPLTTNSLHDVLHLSCLQTTLLAQHSSTLLSKYLKNLTVNAYSGGKTVQTILM